MMLLLFIAYNYSILLYKRSLLYRRCHRPACGRNFPLHTLNTTHTSFSVPFYEFDFQKKQINGILFSSFLLLLLLFRPFKNELISNIVIKIIQLKFKVKQLYDHV